MIPNRQRKPPAQRLFHGLQGSALARIDETLEAKAKLGRPPSGKALSAGERKAKSRLKKALKPAAYAAINKLLEERYRGEFGGIEQPNLLAQTQTEMITKLLDHPNAADLIAAINDNPDNLGLLIPEADQGKGLLISIAGQTIDVFDYGQTSVFSESESIDENQRNIDQKFFMTDESEAKSGPGGKAPKTIRTKWKSGEKYDADNKAFIRNQKFEKIKQLVLAALDSKFTPVEVVVELAIMDDDGQIIQAAKMGVAHKCVICAGIVTDKWEHLESKHNWLVRREKAKARKHLRDSSNKSPIAVKSLSPVTYGELQNSSPNISRNNAS